jgi:hypothetical protein
VSIPKVVIVIRGGMVSGAYGPHRMQLVVVDRDMQPDAPLERVELRPIERPDEMLPPVRAALDRAGLWESVAGQALPATIVQSNERVEREVTLLRQQVEQYQEDPDRCPLCRSSDITGDHVEIIEGMAYQRVGCAACGASWTDAYEFAYIVDGNPTRTRENIP